MIYKIHSRWDGSKVLFEREGNSLREVVIAAVESGANLGGANLGNANLSGANLGDANLGDANLSGADLCDANLSGANLSGANLGDANLGDANLSGADLCDANLSGANLSDANLSGADLSNADLSGANLSDAYLSGADLSGANLSGANLSGANLGDANLGDANLSGADLCDANLSGANLSDANLSDANLSGADLSNADLSGANLSGANLSGAKQDLWEILLRAPKEIAGLRQALIQGRVNGSCYEGTCACLIGTIANVRRVEHTKLGTGLEPNASRPAERWFLAIRQGDTPETNPVVALTVEWIDEFQALLAKCGEAMTQAEALQEARRVPFYTAAPLPQTGLRVEDINAEIKAKRRKKAGPA